MRLLFQYIVSICLLMLPLLAQGQLIDGADTVIARMETPETSKLSQPLRLAGIRFGVDLKPWIQGFASGDRDLYNLHLRLDANSGNTLRYGALLDVTYYDTHLVGDSATYISSGTAARIGLYLNAIPIDPDFNLVSVGIGYGRSWFDESLDGLVKDELYGDIPVIRSSTGLRGGWFELMAGMQARIWKQLYAGYDLQLRLFPHFRDRDLLQIYEIPGFGRANKKTSFGFSYYLLYRIPFGKRVSGNAAPQVKVGE